MKLSEIRLSWLYGQNIIHESDEFQHKGNEIVRKKVHVQVLGDPPCLLENKLKGLEKKYKGDRTENATSCILLFYTRV